MRSVFSLITLFTNPPDDRDKVSESLDNLRTMMEFYGVPEPASIKIAPFYVDGDGWKSDKVDKVIDLIKDRSFFRRFSKQHLVSK